MRASSELSRPVASLVGLLRERTSVWCESGANAVNAVVSAMQSLPDRKSVV